MASTAYTIRASPPAGTYEARLFANDTHTLLATSATITVGTGGAPPAIPAAPSGLVATVASSTQINLSWVDQSNNESGFKIERSTGTGSFAQIATVGTNITTYSNTGLTAGTNYTYRVRSTNSSGDSGYSNTVSATTQTTAAPSLRLNGGSGPITVARGATITITVVNPSGNPKDWIGIFAVGQSSNSPSVVEHYVSSTSYTIPSTTAPGTYEARLFTNDTRTLISTSASITVQ